MPHPFKHFKTITKHRHKVIQHCFKVGIGWQGLFHDLSKYSPTEFVPGARYYLGTKSPNEKERELFGYSLAWMHHKGRNRHHFEYWNDLNMQTKRYEPVPMPLRFITEMFCDRVAACKVYLGDKYTDASAYDYYKKGTGTRIGPLIHPDTAAELDRMLLVLKEEGEDAAFEYIRKWLKE